jgi:hypothetical protein
MWFELLVKNVKNSIYPKQYDCNLRKGAVFAACQALL